MRLVRNLAVLLAFALAVGCGAESAPDGCRHRLRVLIELFGTSDTEAHLRSAEQRAAELVVECMNEPVSSSRSWPSPCRSRPSTSTQSRSNRRRPTASGIISAFREQVNQTAVPAAGATRTSPISARSVPKKIRPLLPDTRRRRGRTRTVARNRGCSGRASDVAYADWERLLRWCPTSPRSAKSATPTPTTRWPASSGARAWPTAGLSISSPWMCEPT